MQLRAAHRALLFDVAAALRQQRPDVVIVERVVDHAAGAARAHEPQAAQQAKLMGDGGLGGRDQFGQLADAQLALSQRVEQSDASGVAEHGERGGQRRRPPRARPAAAGRARDIGLDKAARRRPSSPSAETASWSVGSL